MPTNIFICYKKKLTRERPGGTELRESKAGILNHLLRNDEQLAPWMDEAELGAGMLWESEIYRRILISDVLLVLIEPGTSKSEWVQREIALANALGIWVVPLGSDLTPDEMVAELKAIGIERIQGRITQNIKLNSGNALLAELRADLQKAAEFTKEQQERSLRELLKRRNAPYPKAPDNKSTAVFLLESQSGTVNLHVASGDISKVRGVDAFVNSENDHMQMARYFESKTVSATLRRLGARERGIRYDDTIQHELDFQLGDYGRPVEYAKVFVTSAGGPMSKLVKLNRARYILHVSAVEAVLAEARVVPFKQAEQIEACAHSVLAKIVEVNEARGIVSPPGSEQRLMQEQRAATGDYAVRSVIFPLFGTGQGGSSISEVLGPMTEGMRSFFEDAGGGSAAGITDIYLSAYSKRDVDEVIEVLRSRPDLRSK